MMLLGFIISIIVAIVVPLVFYAIGYLQLEKDNLRSGVISVVLAILVETLSVVSALIFFILWLVSLFK